MFRDIFAYSSTQVKIWNGSCKIITGQCGFMMGWILGWEILVWSGKILQDVKVAYIMNYIYCKILPNSSCVNLARLGGHNLARSYGNSLDDDPPRVRIVGATILFGWRVNDDKQTQPPPPDGKFYTRFFY